MAQTFSLQQMWGRKMEEGFY